MCIRDRLNDCQTDGLCNPSTGVCAYSLKPDGTLCDDGNACLLYTSDAADERSSVDLGGRRIIKKKQTLNHREQQPMRKQKTHTR